MISSIFEGRGGKPGKQAYGTFVVVFIPESENGACSFPDRLEDVNRVSPHLSSSSNVD